MVFNERTSTTKSTLSQDKAMKKIKLFLTTLLFVCLLAGCASSLALKPTESHPAAEMTEAQKEKALADKCHKCLPEPEGKQQSKPIKKRWSLTGMSISNIFFEIFSSGLWKP